MLINQIMEKRRIHKATRVVVDKPKATVPTVASKPTVQKTKAFFDTGSYAGRLPKKPTPDQIRMLLAENNVDNPLNDIVYGLNNKGNINTLTDSIFTALSRPNRRANDCSFAIFAQSGQGKSHVVRTFASAIGLPFVNAPATSLKTVDDLFKMIMTTYSQSSFKGDSLFPNPNHVDTKFPAITRLDRDDYQYMIPPIVVFLDEAHAIPKKMMEAGLLTAMEPDDHWMSVNYEGETVTVDTRNICWVLATTEKGMLFDAFINRVVSLIEWQNAGPEELAQIVRMKVKKLTGQTPSDLFCESVAGMRRVPREAISFAKKAMNKKRVIPSLTWDEICQRVASDMGLDEWGLNKKQVDILAALGQRPIAESRLTAVAKCRIEQIRKYELPELMSYDNGGPFIVSSSRGLCITVAGLAELEKRGISHNGHKVTAEYFENR